MAKFGIAYNVFECGIELLPHSIASIRESVDFISVVYQQTSNQGKKASMDIYPILEDLKSRGLIDEISLFIPRDKNPHVCEVAKRNQGRQRCLNARCDYFMSMDCDELYVKEEFDRMKLVMEDGNHDGGYCQMLTYYKSGEYILDPPETYYVPLFYKTAPNRQYVLMGHAPVLVDPTRRCIVYNPKVFTREEIQMHHFSYVRHDIRKKLENSSALVNYAHKVDEIISDFENFDGTLANIAGGKHSVKRIRPYFQFVI
jgi:hypothetical protein